MEKTNVKVEFRVVGDNFDPEIISSKLALEPEESWTGGDKIKDKNIKRKYSCWGISTGYEESLDVNDQLEKILCLIQDKRNILMKIKDIYTLDYRIDIIINIEGNEKPAIYLNSDIIEFANDIKAEFDFDLYINS